MSDREQDRGHTPEEADQLSRSTKKMKRATARGSDIEGGGDIDMPDIVVVSPNVPESAPLVSDKPGAHRFHTEIPFNKTTQTSSLRPVKIQFGKQREVMTSLKMTNPLKKRTQHTLRFYLQRLKSVCYMNHGRTP